MIGRADSGIEIVSDPQRVEAALWRRVRFEADTGARERLFTRYLVLARSVAASYWRTRRGDREDLEQLAYEGLLQALDRFDPLRGVPFGAFARRRIGGSVVDGLAGLSDLDAQYGARRERARDRVRSLARAASDDDDPLARLGDLALDLAIGLMLDGTGLIEPADGADCRADPFQGLAWTQTQAALSRGVDALPEREGMVIRQHYQNGLSFAHIAALLAVTRGRVSQLHRAGVERLRRRLSAFEERAK